MLRYYALLRLSSPACRGSTSSQVSLPSRVRSPPPTRRYFRHSPTPRLFGLRLPEPSNEPLAGTLPDGSGPPWLFLVQVVVGLPTALWVYKCLVLVLFQRRIIYLPSVPPGVRSESLADGERTPAVDASLSGLDWREVRVRSSVPTRWLRRPVELRGVEMSWREATEVRGAKAERDKVVVVYLQGNAGTPLLRAPLFRSLLREPPSPRTPRVPRSAEPRQPHITLLAVAPRTFWLSTRSTPTERGILADYTAALAHAYARHGPSAQYVLYGHSLGGAAAVLLLEQLGQAPFPPRSASSASPAPADPAHTPPGTPHCTSNPQSEPPPVSSPALPPISALLLENPLPSIPYMVRALYPQRWLPYHYLGPLAFDRWDALRRLERLPPLRARAEVRAPRSLWIRSGRDEIIPHEEGDGVRRMFDAWVRATEPAPERAGAAQREKEDTGREGGDARESKRSRWVEVSGALHDTAYLERRWREEIRGFLAEVAREKRE